MDNRFTIKDFFQFLALAGLGVLLLLAMYMIDRQWEAMSRMRALMAEQAEDIRGLRAGLKDLEQRVAERAAAAAAAGTLATRAPVEADGGVPPAFERARRARARPDFAEGDWHVNAFSGGLKTITPLVSSDAAASRVQAYVLETLLTRSPETLDWQGLVAESWTVSDDGLVITYRLRDGVTFSDGSPLTADDVAFSFDFIMDARIAAPRQRAYYSKIARVHAPDPRTVVFELAEPYFEAVGLTGQLAILSRSFYTPYLDSATDFNESKGLLFGSGPYRLADPRGWTPDAGLVELERNPRYWGPVQPTFSRLIWRIIENQAARLTAYRNGEIDAYSARPREYQTLLDDTQLRAKSHHFEYMRPIVGYSYIGWNQRRGGEPTRFADRRVREAMTLLTDRQRIIDEIMLGYAEPAMSPFNPRSRQHDPALEPRRYDLERGKALLAGAGYADRDGDGVLEDADGERFEFDLVFFQGNEDTRRMALFIKDAYARAGILVNPKPTEWPVMIDLLDDRAFDAITLGWTSGIETDVYQMFHSDQIEGGGDNFVGYANPEFDRLVDAARATVDEDARMPLWQQVERIFHRDQPYTFLMRRMDTLFIDKRIANLEITRLGLNASFTPVEIFVPAPLQRHADR